MKLVAAEKMDDQDKIILEKQHSSPLESSSPLSATSDSSSRKSLNLSDFSTASFPSFIQFPSSLTQLQHVHIQIPLGNGLIDDKLYSSGLFHGVIITDFLETISKKSGEYFFVVLLDEENEIFLGNSKLFFIVSMGNEDYYQKELIITSDRKCLKIKGSTEEFEDIDKLISTLQEDEIKYFKRKIMKHPLRRFSWIYHSLIPDIQQSLGDFTTVAYCDTIPYFKGQVVFHRMNASIESAKKLYNEVKVLSKINHTNIIKFYGFSAFQEIALLTEYCEGGSLHSMIYKNEEYSKNLPEFNRLRLLFQLSEALIYLKSRAIIHRKIEPKTILLTVNLDVKLSNFSCAGIHTVDMVKSKSQSKSIFHKFRWSRYKKEELAEMEFPMTNLPESILEKILKESPYISPETAVNHVFSCQSDLWQFAMTMYELYSQKQPFHFSAGPMYQLHNLICTVSTWKNLPRGTNLGLQEIFKKCTVRFGSDRMKIENVKEKLHDLLIHLNESRV
uniref:Protein kinase domain-containing protein n=1 Tax=Panagrolaimus superbus TaxID=310955 RepID=A0A914Z6L5_9BILA